MPTAIATKLGFCARSIGAAIPSFAADERALKVHSVFSRAVNLEMDGWDMLATITGPDGEGLPQAIALDAKADFGGWELARGDGGILGAGSLRLRGGRCLIEVELPDSRREMPEGPARIAVLGHAFEAAVVQLAREQSTRFCDLRIGALLAGEACVSAMGGRLAASAMELARTVSEGGSVRASVSRLVGLGPGLSPSGDDFLCGFMAAANCSAHELAAAIEEAVEEGIPSTNEISGSLLRCASRGFFPRDLRLSAAAIAAEDVPGAERTIRNLCALGHSSGADTATGFLFGLFNLTSGATTAGTMTACN